MSCQFPSVNGRPVPRNPVRVPGALTPDLGAPRTRDPSPLIPKTQLPQQLHATFWQPTNYSNISFLRNIIYPAVIENKVRGSRGYSHDITTTTTSFGK